MSTNLLVNVSSCYQSGDSAVPAQVTKMLLLVAGDVELNPGPVVEQAADSLTKGLAVLISQAPSEQSRLVISTWAPEKTSIVEDMNKFKVPALKETLAWLWNRNQADKLVTKKVKAEVIDSLIIAIEVLLPDMCSVCNTEYTIGREETPALRCKGCHQGFHQPCLEIILCGQKSLPKLPGSIYWLCAVCSPNYALMTTSGGSKPTAGRKRLPPVHGLDDVPDAEVDDVRAEQPVHGPQLARLPSSAVMSGLPYLWAGRTAVPGGEAAAAGRTVGEAPQPSPVPPPPPIIRSGLPFLWNSVSDSHRLSEAADCMLYLQGECPHGISGKMNGTCSGVHRKRCNKYMKWGSKHEKGCNLTNCGKVHPPLCPK
jgi:hypothetical protein